MRRLALVSLAAGTLAMFASVVAAEAQTRRKTVVVKGRSFLDSGRVVPVGSLQNYVAVGTTFNKPHYDYARGRYGGETLPRLFDLPGR